MRFRLKEAYKDYPSPEVLQHRYLIGLTDLIQEAEKLKSYIEQAEPENYTGRYIERSLRHMFGQLHSLNQYNKKIGLSKVKASTASEPSLKEKVMLLMQLEDTITSDKLGLSDFFKESGLQNYDSFEDVMNVINSSKDLTDQIHSWYSKMYRQAIRDGDGYATQILGIDQDNILK